MEVDELLKVVVRISLYLLLLKFLFIKLIQVFLKFLTILSSIKLLSLELGLRGALALIYWRYLRNTSHFC